MKKADFWNQKLNFNAFNNKKQSLNLPFGLTFS